MAEAAAVDFLELVKAAEPVVHGPAPDDCYDWLEENRDAVAQAIDWFCGAGRAGDAVDMCAAIWPFWMDRGYFVAGSAAMARALAADCDTPTRPRALHGAGVLAFRQGETQRATELHTEALELARKRGDRTAEGRALSGLARVELRNGDFVAVRRLAHESLAAFAAVDDDMGRSSSTHVLAYATMMEGDDEEAVRLFEESLELNRSIGRTDMFGVELANIAACKRRLGNLEEAQRLADESLRLSVERKSLYMLPYNLVDCGGMALARGNAARGARLLAAGDAAFKATGATLDPGVVAQYEDDCAAARLQLGERFESVWSEGAELDLDAAIAYALSH